MRSRAPLFALLFVIGSFALPHFAHAAIPFFGPIIPAATNVCPAGWGMLITVVNNVISLLITLAIVFIAPLMIAYSGFLFVINPYDPSGVSKAKGILTNTIIGIVVALASWMIVDAIMAVLYNPSSAGGTWSSLITSGTGLECLPQAGALPTDTLNPTQTTPGVNVSVGTGTTGGSAAQCANGNTTCSPDALQAAGFSATQANVMSCIAVTESSGIPNNCNGNACGTFQIMLTVNQLVGPACGGTLDCPTLCKGNNGVAVTTAACQPCVMAAKDAACNAQAAQYLYSKSGYAPWTTSSDNTKSAACVQKYGG
jgi:hypothetical protein